MLGAGATEEGRIVKSVPEPSEISGISQGSLITAPTLSGVEHQGAREEWAKAVLITAPTLSGVEHGELQQSDAKAII